MQDWERGYTFTIMCIMMMILIGGSLWLVMMYVTKTIPVEYEFFCNTGFIGVDFKSDFEYQPFMDKVVKSTTYFPNGSISEDARYRTKYDSTYLLKELNIKNIDGLNCHGSFKTEISLGILNLFTKTLLSKK